MLAIKNTGRTWPYKSVHNFRPELNSQVVKSFGGRTKILLESSSFDSDKLCHEVPEPIVTNYKVHLVNAYATVIEGLGESKPERSKSRKKHSDVARNAAGFSKKKKFLSGKDRGTRIGKVSKNVRYQ